MVLEISNNFCKHSKLWLLNEYLSYTCTKSFVEGIVQNLLFCHIVEFVCSSDQIWRNVASHHLLTDGCSAVNGCRQNESPNS